MCAGVYVIRSTDCCTVCPRRIDGMVQVQSVSLIHEQVSTNPNMVSHYLTTDLTVLAECQLLSVQT